MEIKVLDHGYLKLIETWGSDERIIEAARMSTDGGFRGWGPIECDGCSGKKRRAFADECGLTDYETCYVCKGTGSKPGDEKLLRFLYEHKHMTPFEMAGAVIEVQAPIMVFREWHRHRTQSYNEMSGRYTELPDLYYIPEFDRIRAQSELNKQGSGDKLGDALRSIIRNVIEESTENSRQTYEFLLNQGVAREIARLVLPVNQYSRMRASANLRNWMAFLTLRMDTSAQWEIREYANAMHKILSTCFPRTMQLFDGE